MEHKFTSKILQPRQAEVRRHSGDSVEAAVSGTSGMYEAFTKSLKKAKETVSGAFTSVMGKVFPPAQMSLISRELPQIQPKLPPLFEFMNKPPNLPSAKPMHSDSGTSAPTPGRFENENERKDEFEPPAKRMKVDYSHEANVLQFKKKENPKMATPIWKKYQIKAAERINFNQNENKKEEKIKEIEKDKRIEISIGPLKKNEEKIEEEEKKNEGNIESNIVEKNIPEGTNEIFSQEKKKRKFIWKRNF